MKQKFLSRHADGQHFPVMRKRDLPRFPSGRLKKLQPSEKEIAKEMMEHAELVAQYGKGIAVQIARDHVRDAIAKKMMTEPITNVKYSPAVGPYPGKISFDFDGQRITNKIEIVPHEPWVGSWDQNRSVVYVQKNVPEKNRQHLSMHESVEKYLHDDYGLSDMAEGHEAAEEIERRWFVKNVGTEDEWRHDYTPVVEKIHREELEKIGVPMHHEPLPAGGKIERTSVGDIKTKKVIDPKLQAEYQEELEKIAKEIKLRKVPEVSLIAGGVKTESRGALEGLYDPTKGKRGRVYLTVHRGGSAGYPELYALRHELGHAKDIESPQHKFRGLAFRHWAKVGVSPEMLAKRHAKELLRMEERAPILGRMPKRRMPASIDVSAVRQFKKEIKKELPAIKKEWEQYQKKIKK